MARRRRNVPETRYDAIVVGAGTAGLSAALLLGRSRRRVLGPIDGGEPRNAPSAGVHYFLTRDGIPPAEFLRIAREQLSVRPEAVAIGAPGADPATRTRIAATVEQVAYLGGNVQYIVRTSGGLSITALAPKTVTRLTVGHVIDISWAPTEALVLATRQPQPDLEEIPA